MLRRRRNGSSESHQDGELHKSSDEPVKNDEDETTTGISFSSSGCGVLVVAGDADERTNGGCTPHDGANYDNNDDTALLSNRRRSIGFVLVFGCRFAMTILHVAACLFYAFGVHQAQTRLYTHEECDMTYSRRQFIQLQLNDDDATRRSSLPWPDGNRQDVEMEESEETSSTTNDYRLFKFFDQRDPRHVQFLNVPEEQALTGNAWCTNTSNRTMVVYVPGHAGSFQQSRSLGAHGLGLTSRLHGARDQKIVQALGASLTGQDAAALDDINHFVYDVYALDFREQGSGLHGALLEEQARFLVRCIHHLATSCRQQQHVSSSSIYIVAHSMGGIVTRLAMKRHGHIMKASGLHSIITLGTPHTHPIVAWDSSIHSIYQELSTASTTTTAAAAAETDDNSDIDVLLISISGGLRDEMIPPTSCIIRRNDHDSMMRSSDNSLTLLGPQHMVAGTVEARGVAPSLGMDHRAIVWCHNFLSTVRSILFILAKTEYQQQPQQHYSTPRERLDRVKAHLGISIKENGSDEYLVSVQDMRRTVRQRFGRIVALAMETGLVYNLELLVGLFSALAAWYIVLEHTIQWKTSTLHSCLMMMTIPLLVITHCYNYSDWLSIISLPSIVILALVANSIFWMLHLTIKCLFRSGASSAQSVIVKKESSAYPVIDNPLQRSTPLTGLVMPLTVRAISSLTIAFIIYVVLNCIRYYNRHKSDAEERSLARVFAIAMRLNPLTLFVLSSKLFLGAVALSAASTVCQPSSTPEPENDKRESLSRSIIGSSFLILLTSWSGLQTAHYLPALLPLLFMRAELCDDTNTGVVDDQRHSLLAFVVWVLVLLPVFSAGEIYLVAVGGSLYRGGTGSNTTAQVLTLIVPVTIRLIIARVRKRPTIVGAIATLRRKNRVVMETAFQVLRVFFILRWSKVIFKMGVGSHPMFGHHHRSLLSAFSIVDIINELIRLTS